MFLKEESRALMGIILHAVWSVYEKPCGPNMVKGEVSNIFYAPITA